MDRGGVTVVANEGVLIDTPKLGMFGPQDVKTQRNPAMQMAPTVASKDWIRVFMAARIAVCHSIHDGTRVVTGEVNFFARSALDCGSPLPLSAASLLSPKFPQRTFTESALAKSRDDSAWSPNLRIIFAIQREEISEIDRVKW
jgi:hypothetical protein